MKWLLLIFSFYYVKCQVIQDGKCAEVPALTNFNKEKFLGEWYLIKTYDDKYSRDFTCGKDVLLAWNGNALNGISYFRYKTSKEDSKISFTSVLSDNTGSAKFTTTYNLFGENISLDLRIIDTDYENYVVTWACKVDKERSKTYLWVQSRNKTLSEKSLEKVTNIIKKYNLESPILIDLNYDNC